MWKKEKKAQTEDETRLKQNELESCEVDQKTLEMFTTAHAVLDEEEMERVKNAIEKAAF